MSENCHSSCVYVSIIVNYTIKRTVHILKNKALKTKYIHIRYLALYLSLYFSLFSAFITLCVAHLVHEYSSVELATILRSRETIWRGQECPLRLSMSVCRSQERQLAWPVSRTTPTVTRVYCPSIIPKLTKPHQRLVQWLITHIYFYFL